eukprot:scaffold40701_cov63-Phaeocystis_antarctica.AAC.2
MTFVSRHRASLARRSVRAYRPRQTRWISSADFRAKSSPAGLGSTMSGAPAVPRLCQFPKIKKIEKLLHASDRGVK